MSVGRVVLFILLVLLSVIFAYYNLQTVRLKFFGISFESPLFILIFGSFILGFVIAYGYYELKGVGWSRYTERLRKALKSVGTGDYSGAEKELSRLTSREEVLPLYVEVLLKQGKEPSLYFDRYSEGIAETLVAEHVWKDDPRRAINLLEKALGKNWENMRAKRLLRSLYFLGGEVNKAIDLQKRIVKECARAERKREEGILNQMLTCSAEASEESAYAETLCGLAVILCNTEGEKKAKKVLSKAEREGFLDELLMVLLERRCLTPEIMNFVTQKEEVIDPSVLSLIYLNVGRMDRLEDLKENLTEPIKLLLKAGEEERGECFKELLEMMKMWNCKRCGFEVSRYTPVCPNCLEWSYIRVKGGDSNAG